MPEVTGNRAVEDAAVAWVMNLERVAGREPVDRRYQKDFAADIASPPRIIEIKASKGSYRGWFLPLEPVQVERGRIDPNFYIYVVENVGQGDPAALTLKVLFMAIGYGVSSSARWREHRTRSRGRSPTTTPRQPRSKRLIDHRQPWCGRCRGTLRQADRDGGQGRA